MGHSLRETAALGGVADRSTDGPAAVIAFELRQAAGLTGGILVDEARHLTGAAVTAKTGENLLAGVHMQLQ